jgi:hypothetical protein
VLKKWLTADTLVDRGMVPSVKKLKTFLIFSQSEEDINCEESLL